MSWVRNAWHLGRECLAEHGWATKTLRLSPSRRVALARHSTPRGRYPARHALRAGEAGRQAGGAPGSCGAGCPGSPEDTDGERDPRASAGVRDRGRGGHSRLGPAARSRARRARGGGPGTRPARRPAARSGGEDRHRGGAKDRPARPAARHDPRPQPRRVPGLCRGRARRGCLPVRPRPRRPARAGAAGAPAWRQGAVRADLRGRDPLPAAAALSRRDGAGQRAAGAARVLALCGARPARPHALGEAGEDRRGRARRAHAPFAEIAGTLGRVDRLVHCAAVYPCRPILEISDDDRDRGNGARETPKWRRPLRPAPAAGVRAQPGPGRKAPTAPRSPRPAAASAHPRPGRRAKGRSGPGQRSGRGSAAASAARA